MARSEDTSLTWEGDVQGDVQGVTFSPGGVEFLMEPAEATRFKHPVRGSRLCLNVALPSPKASWSDTGRPWLSSEDNWPPLYPAFQDGACQAESVPQRADLGVPVPPLWRRQVWRLRRRVLKNRFVCASRGHKPEMIVVPLHPVIVENMPVTQESEVPDWRARGCLCGRKAVPIYGPVPQFLLDRRRLTEHD
jgi:hypothetical protein